MCSCDSAASQYVLGIPEHLCSGAEMSKMAAAIPVFLHTPAWLICCGM